MKRTTLHLILLLTTCLLATSSCSQKKSGSNLHATDDFVGSTPCDSLIKALLQIPSNTICDFIKWELSLQKNKPDTFQLTALYGEAQNNTNGFKGGGRKIIITGKYHISNGASASPQAKVYSLQGDKLSSTFVLIEMDGNILHFADAGKNLLAGNGGWGYVLNKIQQTRQL
ncbi:MAG: hypothetical protein ACXWWC_04395 [Chitinophagaceae bacterium]